jgi:hypothetical protein
VQWKIDIIFEKIVLQQWIEIRQQQSDKDWNPQFDPITNIRRQSMEKKIQV